MATLTGSIAIGYINRASGKSITGTTSATGYPATNLSTSLLSQAWRSTTSSITNQFLNVDLGSSLDIDIIALIGTNLSDSATRTPLTSEVSNFATLEYNPGPATVFNLTWPSLVSDIGRYGRNLIVLPGSTLNSRYVSVELDDAGNANNYLSARVYWVGPLWQPSIGFACQPDTYRIYRRIIGDPGMQRYITFIEVDLHVLTELEAVQLESICSARLSTGRLFFIGRPTQPASFLRECIYCTLDGEDAIRRIAWPQGGGLIYWKVSLRFRECED